MRGTVRRRFLRSGQRVPKARTSETKLSTFIAWIVAVATLGQFGVAWVQYQFAQSSFREQARFAKEASDDAEKQANRLLDAADQLARSSVEANLANQVAFAKTFDNAQKMLSSTVKAQEQAGRVMNSAQQAFAAQAFPVVKFQALTWIGNDDVQPASYLNPPNSVNYRLRNISGVPVYVRSLKHDLAFCNRPINLGPDVSREAGVILGAGQDTSSQAWSEDLRRAFGRMSGTRAGPNVSLTFNVVYEALPFGRCFRYRATVTVRDTCGSLKGRYHLEELPIEPAACPA
jgi:hypothetical protein